MNEKKQKALFLIILAALFWGATAAVTKIGLLEVPPLSFAFLRFLLASLLVTPFLISKDKGFQEIRRGIKSLGPVSLLATVNIILFTLGIKLTTATIGGLLYAGTPFLTSLFLYFFWKEKISLQKIAGMLLGFLGVSSVILLPLLEKGKTFSGNLEGNILITVAIIFWSLYLIFSQKVQKSYSPVTITSFFIFTTAFALFPFFLLDLKIHGQWWNGLTSSGGLSIVYIAVFATVLAYLVNQYAIKHGGAVLASVTQYLLPIFAFLSAFVLLGERLTFGLFIGGILTLLGIFIISRG